MLLQKEQGVIEKSYYEASVIRPPPAPPLTQSLSTDICVVGGGYAGLSTALELAERGYKVVLLEAQRIGWGASGRNGGEVIVGFGADGEAAIVKQLPKEVARLAWDLSVESLELVQSRIKKYAIDCDYTPGYMTAAISSRKAKRLQHWVEGLQHYFNYPLEWIGPADIQQWIDSPRFYAGTYDTRSGHLHPLKYCLGLYAAARNVGVQVFENSAVNTVRRGHTVIFKTGQGEVRAKMAVLATNVYLSEYGSLAPEVAARIVPIGTYMIATKPMSQERADALLPKQQAVSDNNFVLDYFRLSKDNRLLFGSGETYTATTPRHLIQKMREKMLRVFPQLSDLHIDYAWGGFVDLTMNKAPNLGRLDNNVFYLQGFSGHGVAFTGMAGKLVAEAIAGHAENFDVFTRLHHHRFPGGDLLRTPLLMMGMWYYRLRDIL